MTRILLVEPDSGHRAQLRTVLEGHGLEVVEPDATGASPSSWTVSGVHCVLASAEPAPDGQDVLDLVSSVPVVLIDRAGDARRAVAAMKRGACDYLVSPFEPDELLHAVTGAAARLPDHIGPLNMIGTSRHMGRLFRTIAQVAPTDTTVLIEGESGTGKELVARAIHAGSSRRHAPLLTLNCATVPAELVEAELFGHGAPGNGGLLRAAAGGTLFLDEVGELPPQAQARLLKVLEQDDRDVRLITATHRDLTKLTETGRFRDDLYYRLNVVNIKVPPLRQREGDILDLADAILARTAARLAKGELAFSDAAREALASYRWPGNVRELENAIERAAIVCEELLIEPDMLAIDFTNSAGREAARPRGVQTSLEDYFVSFVTANEDQLTETELAEKLGISRKSLWERRQRLNMPRKKTKKRGPRRNTT